MEQGNQGHKGSKAEHKNTSKKVSSSTEISTDRRRNREKEESQHRVPVSRLRATLLLSCLWIIIWGTFLGIVLYSLEKLPIPVLRFAAAIAAVVAVGGVVIGKIVEPTTVRDFLRNIWQNAYQKLSAVVGLLATIVILGGSYFLAGAFLGPSAIAQISTPGPRITPLPTSSTKWESILKQSVPNCNNSSGANWYVHSGGTRYTCYSSGGAMQQTTSTYYAEMDLMQVKGHSYGQINFRVQVAVAFQTPDDTSTWAALTVQSPANISVPGGYIVTLSPAGICELQQVVTSQSIPTIAQVSVNIDPHRLVKMMVTVQNGILYVFINNQQVISHADNLTASPSIVGLMVERQNVSPSSLVRFSNFELDEEG